MQRSLITYLIFFTVTGILLSGCKAAREVQMPPVPVLPVSYNDSLSGESVAAMPVKQFFTDPYLLQLIDSVLKNNPDLGIALQQVEIARATVAIRKGALLPQVNGVVTASGDHYGKYTMTGVGNFDTNLSSNITEEQKVATGFTPDFFIGFRSTWEIDIWGKLKHQQKAAIARWLATEKGRQYLVTGLVASVASMYYELMALDYELKVVKKNVMLQERALEIVKVQKEGGRATELAVRQFAAQLLNTQALEFRTRQEMVAIESHLNALAGRFPAEIKRDTSLMELPLPSVMRTGVPSDLLLRRPDIQQAEFELEAAKANVIAARKAFLPSLTIVPYAGFNAFRGNVLFNPSSIVYGLIGGITAPIFNGWRIRSDYQMANAENSQAVFNYQKLIYHSYAEVITQFNRMQNNSRIFQLKNQEFEELATAALTARDLYLSGYANYLEIITAQKSLLEAELQLAITKKDIYLSAVDLYRSLGGGWN